jgi:signal peptidase II
MKTRSFRLILVLFALGLFGCDHATKLAAERGLDGRGPLALVPGLLDLRLAHNHDVAFSFLGRLDVTSHPLLLVAAASLVLLVVGVTWWRRRASAGLVEHLGFAAVVAGAAGNVVDRALRGYVVDFIHLHAWPVFNVADVAVVMGAIVIGVAGLRGGGRPKSSEPLVGGAAPPS